MVPNCLLFYWVCTVDHPRPQPNYYHVTVYVKEYNYVNYELLNKEYAQQAG